MGNMKSKKVYEDLILLELGKWRIEINITYEFIYVRFLKVKT